MPRCGYVPEETEVRDMILCGCAVEAQYIKLQIEAKKQKSLSIDWQKFLERQAVKNAEQGKQKPESEARI